jgi:hypothetical protein
MSTNEQTPDLDALFADVDRAKATLVMALRAAAEAAGFKDHEHRIGEVTRAADCSYWRSVVAERARVKGPMVEIIVPSTRGNNGTSTAELETITSGAFVMRGGERYSRKNGDRIGHRDAWRAAPYITEAERARVLALPRPPAPARPRAASKEPRQ